MTKEDFGILIITDTNKYILGKWDKKLTTNNIYIDQNGNEINEIKHEKIMQIYRILHEDNNLYSTNKKYKLFDRKDINNNTFYVMCNTDEYACVHIHKGDVFEISDGKVSCVQNEYLYRGEYPINPEEAIKTYDDFIDFLGFTRKISRLRYDSLLTGKDYSEFIKL